MYVHIYVFFFHIHQENRSRLVLLMDCICGVYSEWVLGVYTHEGKK